MGIAGIDADERLRVQIAGRSLVPLLKDPAAPWPERTLFTHVGRWPTGADMQSWRCVQASVREPRWHLVCTAKDGKPWQLFDVQADPGETTDVAAQHPDVVARLDAAQRQWWSSMVPLMVNETATGPAENPFRTLFREQFGEAALAPADAIHADLKRRKLDH